MCTEKLRHPRVTALPLSLEVRALARLEGWAASAFVASILRGSPKRLAPQDDAEVDTNKKAPNPGAFS
jgi:hypothetical protein